MSQEDQTLPPGIAHLQELFSELSYSTVVVPDEEGFDPTLGVVIDLPYEEVEDQLIIRVQYCETGAENFDDLFLDEEEEGEDEEGDEEAEEAEITHEVIEDQAEEGDEEEDEEEDDESSLQSHTVDYILSFPFELPKELHLEAYELCSELNKTTFLTPWRFDSKSGLLALQYQLLLPTELDENDLSIDIVEQFETIAVEIYPLLVEVLAGKRTLPEVVEILEAEPEFEDFDLEEEGEADKEAK